MPRADEMDRREESELTFARVRHAVDDERGLGGRRLT